MNNFSWELIAENSKHENTSEAHPSLQALSNQQCLVITTQGFRMLLNHGDRVCVKPFDYTLVNNNEPARFITQLPTFGGNLGFQLVFENAICCIKQISPKTVSFFIALVLILATIFVNKNITNSAEAPEISQSSRETEEMLTFLDSMLRNPVELISQINSAITPSKTSIQNEISPPKPNSESTHVTHKKQKIMRTSKAASRNQSDAIDSEAQRFLLLEKK